LTIRKKVPLDLIHPSPLQPRETFDEEKIEELARSITELTLIEPVVLRRRGRYDEYELIAGERRWRACKKAGLKEIDAIIHEKLNDFEALLISGAENIHREDLSSVERENLVHNLWELGKKAGEIRTGWGSYTDLAKRLGMSLSSILTIIEAKEFREKASITTVLSTKSITQTSGLPAEHRVKILGRVEKKEISPGEVRDYVQTIKTASEPVKKALLSPGSALTPELAQKIEQKIKTKKGKQEAIMQIEEKTYHSLEPTPEAVISKIEQKEQEEQQIDLGEFFDIPQEDGTRQIEMKKRKQIKEEVETFNITGYRYNRLDGSQQLRIHHVMDKSLIEVFDGTPAPKSPTDVVCPHYMRFKWALGCPFECAWCYLQGTLRLLPEKTKPTFNDRQKISKHVEYFINFSPVPEVLNAGELSDSLMDEEGDEPFSKFIIEIFKQYQDKGHKVLFLSRSDQIDHLLKAGGQDVAICSFTVNAIPADRRWEQKAAPVQKRLAAAKKLKEAGYEVRLRIDPIIPIENWEEAYIELVDLIFEHLLPDRITLGSLRGLQSVINNAQDTSWKEYLEEQSSWGFKIPFETRLAMYKTIVGHLKKKWKFSSTSLCKETLAMWIKLAMDYTRPRCNCME
jgi:ParB/RepB/Spo0J family partition protein